jgi:hypothetical protein
MSLMLLRNKTGVFILEESPKKINKIIEKNKKIKPVVPSLPSLVFPHTKASPLSLRIIVCV